MVYLLVFIATVVVGTFAWTWWRDRDGRDPVSSIASFHRALDAMRPGSSGSVRVEEEVEERSRT